jgi:hypothetical protein
MRIRFVSVRLVSIRFFSLRFVIIRFVKIPVMCCYHRNQTISRKGAHLLGLLYGGGASFVQKWSMPWMSANI